MISAKRAALAALSLAALTACEQSAETDVPAGKRAAGEVLGGTISDEMIPLDELRSQSPPMRVVPADGADDGTGGEADAAAEAEPADDGDAEPAREPAAPPASDDAE